MHALILCVAAVLGLVGLVLLAVGMYSFVPARNHWSTSEQLIWIFLDVCMLGSALLALISTFTRWRENAEGRTLVRNACGWLGGAVSLLAVAKWLV